MKRGIDSKHFFHVWLTIIAIAAGNLYIGFATGISSWLVISVTLIWACIMGVIVRFVMVQVERLNKTSEQGKHVNEPKMVVRLLKLVIPSNAEQQNIIGDLLEEFSLFESKPKAYLWLYKQILTSACPLFWKTIKNKLASVFSERVR